MAFISENGKSTNAQTAFEEVRSSYSGGKEERAAREGSVDAQVTLQRYSRFSCLLPLTVRVTTLKFVPSQNVASAT